MAKHIKAQVFTFPNFNKGLLKVTEQTHVGTAFGNSDDGKTFTASNGITLGSSRYPARDTEDNNTIWLRGINTDKDDNCIAIPVSRMKKVVEAIKEYNDWYTREAINARVRAKRAKEAAEAARFAELVAGFSFQEIVG